MNPPTTSDLPRKRLPIGIQTFSEIRRENHYYVDKTAYAYRLATESKHYFLSRPRRFGKSLFLDTLHELFAGNEPLFRGLYCHDKWDWALSYPVIRISFGSGRVETRAQLDERIGWLLAHNAERLGVACREGGDIPGRFSELIQNAEQKYGQRVVILIDEYDKPMLDNISSPELARTMRDGLRNLYSVIKDNDAHIRFSFLTGVSKFSKVSIFSGLNNLRDITLLSDYSAICGYTDGDVDTVFAPELPGLDRQQIRDWYNGYNWTGEAVYNPFDLLLLFKEREFRSYWFETGTPTFLIEWLAQRGYFTPELSRHYSSLDLLSAFDVDRTEAAALLFQTGYITLQKVEEYLPGQRIYWLGYPNKEVQVSLNSALLPALGQPGQEGLEQRIRLLEILRSSDFAAIERHVGSLFASIPHDWYRNNPIANYEGYYASVFYSHFAALGLDIVVEDATNRGRIDMTVLFNRQVYIFEFKVLDGADGAEGAADVESAAGAGALDQIKSRDYAAKYRARQEPIHLIGVEFSRQSRSVTGFALETLAG